MPQESSQLSSSLHATHETCAARAARDAQNSEASNVCMSAKAKTEDGRRGGWEVPRRGVRAGGASRRGGRPRRPIPRPTCPWTRTQGASRRGRTARAAGQRRACQRARAAGRLRSSWHVGSAKSYVCSAKPYVCSAESYNLAEQTCEMLLRGLRVRKERRSPGCPSPTRVGTAQECVGAREGGLGLGR